MAKIVGLARSFPDFVRKNSAWSAELVASFQNNLKRDFLDLTNNGVNNKIDQFSLDNIQREKSDPFVGAIERRVIGADQPSYEFEKRAAQIAIDNAKVDPKDIGAIFCYSFAPDRIGLPSANIVADMLGLKNSFGCQLETACSSQMVQLKMATALIDSGAVKFVLLISSNMMTRGLQMSHPASPGIGDAATAILIGPDTCEGHKIINTFSRSHGDYWDAVSWRRRQGDSQNWWEPGGDFYLGSYNSAKARELLQITATVAADTVKSALEEANLSVKDLNFLVAVQPRKWTNTSITRALGMPDENSIETYEKYAHLGCCGPVVNLIEAAEQNKLNAGDLVALYAQGMGFTRSASIIVW